MLLLVTKVSPESTLRIFQMTEESPLFVTSVSPALMPKRFRICEESSPPLSTLPVPPGAWIAIRSITSFCPRPPPPSDANEVLSAWNSAREMLPAPSPPPRRSAPSCTFLFFSCVLIASTYLSIADRTSTSSSSCDSSWTSSTISWISWISWVSWMT